MSQTHGTESQNAVVVAPSSNDTFREGLSLSFRFLFFSFRFSLDFLVESIVFIRFLASHSLPLPVTDRNILRKRGGKPKHTPITSWANMDCLNEFDRFQGKDTLDD